MYCVFFGFRPHLPEPTHTYSVDYFEYINNGEQPINFIVKDKGGFFLADNSMENYMRQNFLCITNINKPIKSFSSYTKTELEEIAHKLNIYLQGNYLKKDLYQAIIEYI